MTKSDHFRTNCYNCHRPKSVCFCEYIQRFDSKLNFIILMHPIEMKRKIATGRMSFLSLENSEIIVGYDYSENIRINELISNPENHCMVLYPSRNSINLSQLSNSERYTIIPKHKKPVIFVIDGTWHTARKTMFWSTNLKQLPSICFDPQTQSRFLVRKQPKDFCLSTIEAIHQTIEYLAESCGFEIRSRKHDALLHAFGKMVAIQLKYVENIQHQYIRTRHQKTINKLNTLRKVNYE